MKDIMANQGMTEGTKFLRYDVRSYSLMEVMMLAQQYLNVKRTRNEIGRRRTIDKRELA